MPGGDRTVSRPSCPRPPETVTTLLRRRATSAGPKTGDALSSVDMWPGAPYPLGASYDGGGTNFAIVAEVAERVELCVFDDDGSGGWRETRYGLPEREALVWHG